MKLIITGHVTHNGVVLEQGATYDFDKPDEARRLLTLGMAEKAPTVHKEAEKLPEAPTAPKADAKTEKP